MDRLTNERKKRSLTDKKVTDKQYHNNFLDRITRKQQMQPIAADVTWSVYWSQM